LRTDIQGTTLYLAVMIELPLGFTDSLIANANTQIANFSPLLLLIMGLALALIAVGSLISFVKHK